MNPRSGLDSQVQLQLTVNPIDTLVVPTIALDIAQIKGSKARIPNVYRFQSIATTSLQFLRSRHLIWVDSDSRSR